jgi:hypothetical protein
MIGFTAVDLTPQCEVRQKTHYQYDLLAQIEGAIGLIALFSSHIWRDPQQFEISTIEECDLALRWVASGESAGIATLRDTRNMLSLSLLASGIDPEGDQITLEAYQNHVVHELHDTEFEPSFDLIHIWQRPLVATVGLTMPQDEKDRRIFALADRCFAAAYFRRLGLA